MKSHQDKNISNESGLSSKLNQEPYNTSNESILIINLRPRKQ